jgi:site-specific DNA-methyltransferase (adenine-specific)
MKMDDKKNKTRTSTKGTKTNSFGSKGRSSHDSSDFYSGKIYDGIPKEESKEYKENSINNNYLNKIFCKSSEEMDEIPDNSVHLVITSPPYNVGKVYDEDLNLDEYRSFLSKIMTEIYRVLVPGGRFCLNLANLGRKPYIPLESYITQDLLSKGFLMRGQIIWDKASSSSGSTAWGSWISATNPTLRDIHEYILVFSKNNFSRPKVPGRESTISKSDFLELTKSIWRFPTESASKIGHPAPFPVELARRCIQLYTYSNEIVLDPFMGSGTTAVASILSNRQYLGYETNQEYVDLSLNRLSQL